MLACAILCCMGVGQKIKWILVIGVIAATAYWGISHFFARQDSLLHPIPRLLDVDGTRARAEKGDVKAQNQWAAMCLLGDGVKQDDAEAAKWYRKAAVQGDAEAQFSLGVMYEKGRGIAREDSKAVEWHRKVAEQGHAEAQFNLGALHAKGQGVAKDYIEACKWFNLAAAQGLEDATKACDSLARIMTPEQIAEARRRTLAYKPGK